MAAAGEGAKFGRRAATPSGGAPPGTASNAAQLAKLKELQAAKGGARAPTASGYTPSTGTGARPAPVRPSSRQTPSAAGPRPGSSSRPMPPASKPPGAPPTAAPPSRNAKLAELAAKKGAKPPTAAAAAKPPAKAAAPPAPPAARPATKQAKTSAGARPTTAYATVDETPAARAKAFSAVPPELAEAKAEPLLPCKSCKRSFTKDALAKHAKVCAKVFVQKRKPLDVQAQRVAGTDAAKYVAKVGKAPAKKPATAAKSAAAKKAKWKQESAQLRQAMQAARAVTAAQKNGQDIRTVEIPQLAEEDDDRVLCPTCGRKFNQNAADRHIPQCKDIKAKPSVLKAGQKTKAPPPPSRKK
eukprot:356174-Chlamydomonas_euryale.AAC.3